MELKSAANWAQILSLLPGGYCAYAAWITLHRTPIPTDVPAAPDNLRIADAVVVPVNSTWVLVAIGAFVALVVLGGVLTVLSVRQMSRREHPETSRETKQAALTPIRVLERFYMALVQLRDHVDRIVWLDKEMNKNSTLYPLESALEKIRGELMNLSPTVFPTATALDFQQKPPSGSGYVEPSARLSKAIDELLATIDRHWGMHAEKVGITPLSWKRDPIVKLQDE